MTYISEDSILRDAALHNHHVALETKRGHKVYCQKVTGNWDTIYGVGVNWPTILDGPVCTCGLETQTDSFLAINGQEAG